MRFVRSVGRFWYDFVIGDDWKIAVGVVLAIVTLCGLMLVTPLGDTALTVIGGTLLVGAFAGSLAVDVRSRDG